jgi:aromatic ring-cleaving dioxygenase
MSTIDAIAGYHAHVYYDAASKDAAGVLRDKLAAAFEVELGRWHDTPVGPHPCGSYQIAFGPQLFATLVPWLALNRGGLTVFVHPNTGQALADHSAHVIWLGESRALNLDALR